MPNSNNKQDRTNRRLGNREVNKMTSIIIYTTPEKLLHKQGRLKGDPDHSDIGEYYWELSRQPKRLQASDKIYFATKGTIKGYFEIEELDMEDTFQISFYADSWKDIKPIPIIHFQGFKYADKIGGLK